MIETSLVYEMDGRFRCTDKASFEAVAAKLVPGQPVKARLYKPRSIEQHKWFFAMVQAAFDNQRAGPPYPDSEGLRKWLLMQVGHCNVIVFDPEAMTPQVAHWLRDRYGLDFTVDVRTHKIYAREAKSIAFDVCDGDQMRSIADRVIDVIISKVVPGTSRADWEPHIPERGHEAGSRPAVSRRASARSNRPATSSDAKG